MLVMLNITEFEVQLINDAFGILPGDRYEFLIYLDVPEDDELYNENGVYIRALFVVDGEEKKLLKYDLVESGENKVLDFDLEDDEIQAVTEFCEQHYHEAV